MSQASIWALDQPPELHSLLRSSLEVAEDDECDYCETIFQNCQFWSYRQVIYIKKLLRSYWLQIWKKNVHFLAKKRFWTVFVKNYHFWRRTKILTLVFFEGKSKNHKKLLYQRKVGILIVKVKKFGVVWYIPLEMTAKSARGGSMQTLPPVLTLIGMSYESKKSSHF